MSMHYTPGKYVCEVTEQAFQKASTGKLMVVLKVMPQQRIHQNFDTGEDDFVPIDVEQYDRTVRLVVNPDNTKSMDYLFKKLRYAGFEGSDFSQMNLVGSFVRAECKQGTYNDEPSEQWDLMLPPLASGPLEHDPSLARKMNALFDRQLREKPESNGDKPKPEPATTAAAAPPDDEVPF